MGPKKAKRVSDSVVKRPKRITVETKKEIIFRHENGFRVSDIARQYEMAKSTICTILKNKEALKAADVAKGVTMLTKQRSQVLEEVEKLLLVWIYEKKLSGDSVNEALICEKALLLHDELVMKMPNTSKANVEEFKASRGWFEKFRRRTGFQNAGSHGKVVTSDGKADAYVDEFGNFTYSESPRTFFNVDDDKTLLFWEKMPTRTCITQEGSSLPGHKQMKDILTLLWNGKAATSDKNASDDHVEEFSNLINSDEGYVPHQVFNCNETELLWKKMPRRTYITQEEESLSGHTEMNERLTLLLCANASGDCKIKPLSVYHSENPFVFNNVRKDELPVLWRANSEARVTKSLFAEWLIDAFAPTVKKFLEGNNLPLKCLLVIHKALDHPANREEDLDVEYDFIKVRFLPPNINPNQQIISNFKRLYTKALFSRCLKVTNYTNLNLRDFWKDHYHILHSLNLIDKAWKNVSNHTLQSTWRSVWPGFASDTDFDETDITLINEIVTIGKSLGLEVNEEDVLELVEDNRQEPNKNRQDQELNKNIRELDLSKNRQEQEDQELNKIIQEQDLNKNRQEQEDKELNKIIPEQYLNKNRQEQEDKEFNKIVQEQDLNKNRQEQEDQELNKNIQEQDLNKNRQEQEDKELNKNVQEQEHQELNKNRQDQELNTEGLELQIEHIQEKHSGEEEVQRVSSDEIKGICSKWSEVQIFIEKHHPNKTATSSAVDILNCNVMSHFREIIQQRQDKMSLNPYLVKTLPTELAIEPFPVLQRIEKTPEIPTTSHDDNMEWNSSSKE